MGYIIYLLKESHNLLKTSQCFCLFILSVEFLGCILARDLVEQLFSAVSEDLISM